MVTFVKRDHRLNDLEFTLEEKRKKDVEDNFSGRIRTYTVSFLIAKSVFQLAKAVFQLSILIFLFGIQSPY